MHAPARPEAQQLAVYIGWLLHNIRGGIVAGALFVIPSMFILFGLSYVYVAFGQIAWVASVFDGLKAAVMAIVFGAVIRIGQKSLKNRVMISVAAISFSESGYGNSLLPISNNRRCHMEISQSPF